MGTLYVARLTQADHDTLKDRVHMHPTGSHDKWLERQAKEIKRWETGGGKVIPVDVSADDVARYCSQTGARCDVHIYKAIAFAKAHGKFK